VIGLVDPTTFVFPATVAGWSYDLSLGTTTGISPRLFAVLVVADQDRGVAAAPERAAPMPS
jgi:hypothetical protein